MSFPSSPSVTLPSTQQAVVSIGADKDPIVQSVPTPSFDSNGDLILVQIKASSLNPVDWKSWIYNDHFMKQSLPFVLGWDFSGVIIAVGKNAVGGWRVGDEVFSAAHVGMNGVHTDYCLVDGLRLARKPKELSHLDAASLPTAFCVAYDAIINLSGLSSSKIILISGASGGIGHLAVQLSKILYGAKVIALANKKEGIELLKSLGAVDYIIDYKNDDVGKKVFEITKGQGVDIVFDSTAGPSYLLTSSLIKEGGTFIGVDFHPPSKDAPFWKVLEEKKITNILFADIGKTGVVPEYQHTRIKVFQAALTLAAELLISGRIKLHRSNILSLNDVPKQLIEMKNGKSFVGKVAVKHE